MKTLVFGAGVIGTTYAWQLSEAGFDVSLLVRKHKLTRYRHSGISINCTDMRGSKQQFAKTVFRPKTTDHVDPHAGYDLIIVSVKNFQLKEVLPYIAKNAGKAHVLFLGNLWDGFDMTSKHLPPSQILFGFPAIAGGGKTDNSINCFLFKNGHTMLGGPGGKTSGRLKEIAQMLDSSGMQPKITTRITAWLKAHYILPAASFGAVCKAGSVKSFVSSYKLVKQSALAIREGFRVCRKEKVNPLGIFPYSMFYLPAFIVTPLLRRSYNAEMVQVMEGHLRHGFDEMKQQYSDILHSGKKHGVSMPHFSSFARYIAEAEKKQTVS